MRLSDHSRPPSLLPPGKTERVPNIRFSWRRPPSPRTDALEVAHRIGGNAVDPDLEVDVRAEAVAGAVAVADHLALGDLLAGRHREGFLVGVAGREPAAV